MVKHGNIHSGIPSTDIKTPITLLGNNSYSIMKKSTDYSATSLRTEIRSIQKKITERVTIKSEGIISFIYWR